ncbi:MAG TPA: prolyl oligopeptidase family serine peptidase [Pyrinomonadaceae bacterium]|nr:prolyl oligopeptidase family serine peptidase [Pyrinomonadaceae bacterium]
MRPFRLITINLGLLALALAHPVSAQDGPPKAAVHEVTDTYFGTKIVDPYRWMEDAKSPETAAWMKAQADYTRAYLDRLPIRALLLKRFEDLSETGVRVSGVQRAGNFYFYYRLAPGENDRRLYVREGFTGAERLLVDPDKLSSPGKRYSIDSYNPSFDGKYVSYTVSVGGSEMGEMRVVETGTGRDMGERIDRARFGAGAWLPDNHSFLYNRLQRLAEGAPPTDLYQKSRVYLHVLGKNPDDDKVIFGYEVNANIKMEPTPLPFAYVPIGSKYVFAVVNSGVSPNSEYYVTTVDKISQTPIPWRKIASLDDDIAGIDIHGDDLYLTTYRNTPRFKVIHINLAEPDLAKAETVFPAGEAVVTNIGTAKDAVYVQTLDGGVGKLWRVDYKGGAPQRIKLPYDGTAFVGWTDQGTDGLLFGLTSWTKSTAYFAFDPKTQAATNIGLGPPIPIDMSNIESASVKAKSYDGTMVPLVILYKRGLKRDGTNPTLLNGYGAYGINNTEPFFASNFLPWLERGGVIALAGVRGGGEYGEEWHLAGKEKTKPNTWKDFIACAEYLIREKYTSSEHLAGQGGSAGGILIGNSIVERPELFGAAIDQVGDNNALRFEVTSNGIPNIPEFGSVKTEEGFKALLEMDAYQKVKDGVKYPAVLLTTGINDPRVEPWMSAKMAARLQVATTSSKPVLLRIDYDAGHGFGSTKRQRNEQNADIYAFLFQQLGSK